MEEERSSRSRKSWSLRLRAAFSSALLRRSRSLMCSRNISSLSTDCTACQQTNTLAKSRHTTALMQMLRHGHSQKRLSREHSQKRLSREHSQKRLSREYSQKRLSREYSQKRLSREYSQIMSRHDSRQKCCGNVSWPEAGLPFGRQGLIGSNSHSHQACHAVAEHVTATSRCLRLLDVSEKIPSSREHTNASWPGSPEGMPLPTLVAVVC